MTHSVQMWGGVGKVPLNGWNLVIAKACLRPLPSSQDSSLWASLTLSLLALLLALPVLLYLFYFSSSCRLYLYVGFPLASPRWLCSLPLSPPSHPLPPTLCDCTRVGHLAVKHELGESDHLPGDVRWRGKLREMPCRHSGFGDQGSEESGWPEV